MVDAGSFKNGLTIEVDGEVCQVIEFQHVKPGKGAAFVRTKLRNVMTGSVVERTFRPTEKFENAHIDRADMQYLYDDGDSYIYMNMENYEQIQVPHNLAEDSMKFVKENEMVKICSYKGHVFSVEPPIAVVLEVTDTEPGFKGNTLA